MKKTIYLKSVLLLCLLLVGAVSTQAQDYDYEWVKVTDLSTVTENDVVLLVDVDKSIALPYNSNNVGASVTISEDGTIADNVSDKLKWKLTKDEYGQFTFTSTGDEYQVPLYGYSNGELSVGKNSNYSGDYTTNFIFEEYGENGGLLGCFINSYITWKENAGAYRAVLNDTGSKITLYKRAIKNYVKWKRIDSDKVNLEEDAVIVVVNLESGRALSNDKADKDPDAVAVTLNDDNDRILGEVPEKVQWIYNRTQGKGATFKTKDGNYLYADTENKGLKVGEPTGDNQYFSYGCTNNIYFSLWTSIESATYLLGVEESMFSNTWKLIKPAEGEDIDLAFFKKIEDPQKIVTIELAEYYNYDLKNKDQYTLYERDFNEKVTITGAEKSEINWTSSNPDVAEINPQGVITLKGIRGTTVITAYVEEDTENHYYDKASAKCTVIVDDSGTAELGTKNHPLTVAEAKELAETGKLMIGDIEVLKLEEGVNYYIKGKVSKVNSGMMAMFGDMDFGEMMGGSGSGMNFEDSMDDMDFDMEDMEESGFDMSSMGFDMSSLGFDMSAMFGTSDKVTYYISDDGTKDGQMKVINGCGTLKSSNGTMEFNPIPKLSPGDCVVVCGPLVYTKDESMFSGMMSNNSDEPKMSGKVDEMNYLAVYDQTLLVEDKEIYVNKSLKVVDGGYTDYLLQKGLYSIDNLFNKYNGYNDEVKITDLNQIKEATFKSSDEDIVKWDEDKKELVGVNEGKAKITVKVKVVLQEKDDNADPKVEEKSYTMKRKFKLIVKTRDLDPAGYYDGEWKLTTTTDSLFEGTRIVLAGTRVKKDKESNKETYTDYMMVENNAMMGGGKNGSKIEFDAADTGKTTIESETVIKKKGLEVVLEQAEDGTSWYLNVGQDENGKNLYLYASDTSEDKEEGEGDGQGDNKFDFNKIMEMFSPSSGLKVDTMSVANKDSLQATISFNGNIATIAYNKTAGKNNTIMLTSSFDMEEMMGMFGGMGGNNNEEQDPDDPEGNNEQTEEESTFDMGSFDMFMASFNTKKSGDENPTVDEETGEQKDPKCFMPRIYRFVPYASYSTAIGSTEWKTIVSYKDVTVPEEVKAYVVTKVVDGEERSKALLTEIKDKKLKGGEPYLLHSTTGAGDFTLTLLTPYEPDVLPAPDKNLLLVSNKKTSGESGNTSVYVLANKSNGVGFYRWTGGDLGSGRVYLPAEAILSNAHEYCGFFVEDATEVTGIQSVEDIKTNVGPFYDLQGRRVQHPTKGVYVVNGKKVIIK